MRLLRNVVLCVCLLGLFGLTGCSSKSNAEPAANAKCPIMGKAVTAEGGTATWDGKTVGFCCGQCRGQWDKLTDDVKKSKLTKAMEGKKGAAPSS